MDAPTVVEQLDVVEDLRARFLSAVIIAVMNQLVLKRAEKTLHRGVVVAIAFGDADACESTKT